MQNRDPLGYYAALGLEPSASPDEVKRAYREFAKETHPDTSQKESVESFRELTRIYKILIDPRSRAEYDSSGFKVSGANDAYEAIEPVRCSSCGRVTAQPRYLIFWRVYSFIVGTIKRPVQGIFCADCARREALKSSAISAIAGWWGVPWGPIYTVLSIARNGIGGERPPGSEERLIWYNCLAFLSQGHNDLAYALAKKSNNASEEKIAAGANRLIAELERSGHSSTRSALKNVWQVQPIHALAHFCLAAALPIGLAAIIYYDETAAPSSAKYASSAPDLFPQSGNGGSASATSQEGDNFSLSLCPSEPRNGQLLESRFAASEFGHVLEIDNGSEGNAIVKLRDAVSNQVIGAMYVQQNKKARIQNIPDGAYRVQYAIGKGLAENCMSFTGSFRAWQFPKVETFATRRTSTQIVSQHLTYTLYPVSSGNVRPQSLSIGAFDAP